MAKRVLSVEDIEAQTAFELPDRDTPALVAIGCVGVCVGQIIIRDVDVAVANNVCANIGVVAQALNNVLSLAGFAGQEVELTCDVRGDVNQ